MSAGAVCLGQRRPTRRLRLVVAVLLSSVMLISGGACRHEAPSADLRSFIDALVAQMPRKNQPGYSTPLFEDHAAFRTAVSSLIIGKVSNAREAIRPLGYEIKSIRDSRGGGRDLYIIQEVRGETGAWRRAWGTFIIARDAVRARLVVEVPHPLHDEDTEIPGIAAFRASGGRALLIAGAHRHAAGNPDVAHLENSIFQTVHEALITASTITLQFHGFEEDSGAARPAGAELIILSSGRPSTTAAEGRASVNRIARALESHGWDSCIYTGPGSCLDLGGTQNKQGISCHEARSGFVQLEAANTLRTEQMGSVVGAVA